MHRVRGLHDVRVDSSGNLNIDYFHETCMRLLQEAYRNTSDFDGECYVNDDEMMRHLDDLQRAISDALSVCSMIESKLVAFNHGGGSFQVVDEDVKKSLGII